MNTKRNFIIITLTAFLMGLGLPSLSMAVEVFAECAYTDLDVECYIYAKALAPDEELRSGGVKLIYAVDQFETDPEITATATKNTTDWYFGDPTGTTHNYIAPDTTTTAGEVVIIVGKLDTRTGPPDLTGVGVSGERILIGTVKLIRTGSDPALFGLDLALGVDDGVDPPDEGYVNFVTTAGDDLDSSIAFNHPDFAVPVIVAERGDTNASGRITLLDSRIAKQISVGNLPFTVFADCVPNGKITLLDSRCIKSKF